MSEPVEHFEPICRFVRAADGAWRVAVPNTLKPNVGDKVRVRRRDKSPQWISVGAAVEAVPGTNETTYEVRRRHAGKPEPKPIELPAPPVDVEQYVEELEDAADAAIEALKQTETKYQQKETPLKPEAPVATPGSVDAAIAALVQAMAPQQAPLDEARVIELVIEHAPRADETRVEHVVTIKREDKEPELFTGQHKQAASLLTRLQAGVTTMMVGPAGSGKTSAARFAAKALGVPFYFTGAVVDRFALLGFRSATGEVVHTQFSQAVRQPCVFLFDEIDASAADAVLAFNAAIDNRIADLPEGQVEVHPECRFVAAANTFGRGADRLYVGRNQQDAAAMDRFAMMDWEYDRDLERKLATNAQWCKRVHQVRAAVESLKVRHVVSMRAIVNGSKLLDAGLTLSAVEDAVLWRGLDADSRTKVERAIKG